MVLTPVRNISTPRLILMVLATLILAFSSATNLQAQRKNENQSGLSNLQRLDVMRSKLDAMRRSLDNAIAGLNAKDAGDSKKNPDDPRERLRSLEKEVGSVLSEVNDLHSKEEHAEKYDASKLDGLETSVAELNTRVEAGLQATAGARTSTDATSSNYHPKPQKNRRRLLGLLPGKSNDKYAELTGSVAPGRDRVLFVEAAKEVRKGSHETGRLLFTTIITTYPDSPYLPMAKPAIPDSFYLDARYSNHKGGLKGGQDRLKEIVEKYPNFCLMDEVLFRYATTYQEEEEPDEAAKLYQQLVRDFPNSEYVEKAKDQLKIIGAAIPDADLIKKSLPPCEKLTFMQNMMQQLTGSANVTTSRDGILITRHGEGTDLIDKAIANNGTLPDNALPQPVFDRTQRPPANPQPSPVRSTPNGTPANQMNPATPATRPRQIQTPTPQP